jgi:hypothetical protein
LQRERGTEITRRGWVFYTGNVVIHSGQGDLYCTDAGTLQTTGNGGTGHCAGAAGYMQEVGTFVAGRGTAEYRGADGAAQVTRQKGRMAHHGE